MTVEQIAQKMQENDPTVDTRLIFQAYEFAKLAHGEQKRKSGEPYIIHPLHTAYILAQIKADLPTVIAGLLHDVPEDTSTTIEEVEATFGGEIASLVAGVTKLSKVKYRGIERYRESLRKMFLNNHIRRVLYCIL
jgi:GTP pyrophosphokinase